MAALTQEDLEIAYRLAVRSFGPRAVTLRGQDVVVCIMCSVGYDCTRHSK